MSRTFYADTRTVESHKAKRRTQGIMIFAMALVLLIAIIIASNDDYLYDWAKSFHTQMDTIHTWCVVICVISAIFLISAIVIVALSNSELKRLSSSCITVGDEGVNGTHYPYDGAPVCQPFAVKYEAIEHASARSSAADNLSIVTKDCEYRCYALSNASEIASLINKKVEELKNGPAPKDTHASSGSRYSGPAAAAGKASSAKPSVIFCMKCGAKAPANARYCPKCGEDMV